MSKKRALLFFVFFFLVLSGSLFAQPSIAFLDTLVDPSVDRSVQGPVTEKIIQELVASGKYTVLDRAHISQVLKEKQFQLSGLVADAEIKQAGIYLGAAFVGIAQVSKVGNTYFVSAKIINVETGAIVSQVSAEMQGGVEVVLVLAKRVGVTLTGGEAAAESGTVAAPEPLPVPRGKQPAAREKALGNRAKAHVLVSYMMPGYFGSLYDLIEAEHAETMTLGYDDSSYGFDLHVLQPLFSLFYVSAGMGLSSRSVIYNATTYQDFSVFDLRFLVGAAVPIGEIFQVYAGVGGGVEAFSWGAGNGAYWTYEGTETGTALCIEAGADMFLAGFIAVGMRLQLVSASLSGDYTDGDDGMGYVGFTVGAGISY